MHPAMKPPDDVVNRGRLHVIDEIYAENMVDHDPVPGSPPGREGVHYSIGSLREAVPLAGLKPSNKQVTYHGVVIFRLDHGRIVERWALTDMMTNLGVAEERRPRRRSFLGESVTPYVSLQPIRPEKFAAWQQFVDDLNGSRREEMAASRKRMGLDGIQFEIVYYAFQDLRRGFEAMATSQEPFDVWFRERVKDVHNMDINAALEHGGVAHLIYDSKAPLVRLTEPGSD